VSCWMMNLGQEDRQLIFSILKFYHPSRNTLFTQHAHLRRSLMFRIQQFWIIYATGLKWNCSISVGYPNSWRSRFASVGFRNVRSRSHARKDGGK
jgi:hypothetical protein